jgi:hypothetical protein
MNGMCERAIATLQPQNETDMKFEYDPKTKTYLCQIVIGDKEPLSPEKMRTAMRRAIGGATGQLVKKLATIKDREFTDMLFWFEEGWQ